VIAPGCDLGAACEPVRGCTTSPDCIAEMNGEIGGADDPVVDCPGTGPGIPTTSFEGGYCATVANVDAGGCDPDEDSCQGCGRCLSTGQTSGGGSPITFCAQSCTPSLTENACRDGYMCAFDSEVCLPGCQSDPECQVHRADTNENGIIDPYDATTHPEGDRLTCAGDVVAYCDVPTGRCRHPGAPGAEAGATCTTDFECERDGDCLVDRGDDGGFPGGYCTKFGCDLAGNACAGDGRCQERGIGVAICVEACEVAQSAAADDPFADSRDCRPGYGCFWDGTSGADTDNGGCLPGNFNDVRTANVGSACADESECWSPHGLGQCRDFGAGDHCTLFDCGAPGMALDVCGDDALCAMVTGSSTTLCVQTCETAGDCIDGAGCWDTSMAGINTGGERVCFPGCREDGDCQTDQSCVGASATAPGECA
jgi:hypothetical protein